jgi:uncharacterized membrane protein YbhN (UPF0104 family)
VTADAAPAEAAAPAGNDRPHKRRASAWLLRAAFVAVGLLAVSRMIRPADISRAVTLVRHAGWPLLFVLFSTGIGMGIDAHGWQLVLRAIGQRVPWRPLYVLRLSAEAIVLALPGGAFAGEAMKLALLRRRGGVPIPVGGASLALNKASHIGGEAIYLAIGAAWLGVVTLAGGGPPSRIPLLLAVVGAALTGLASGAMFILLRDASVADRLARLLGRIPIARFRRAIQARRDGFVELDRTTRSFFDAPLALRARAVAVFVVEWLIEGAEMLLILRCLGVSLGIGSVLVMDGAGSLLRALVFFVPAGLGFQDAAHILLLRWLGVDDAAAVGAALIVAKRSKEVFWVVTGASFLAVKRDTWRESSSSAAR